MNIESPEALASSVANLIPLDPPPTEAQIDTVLAGMATGFGLSNTFVIETRKLLHASSLSDWGLTTECQTGYSVEGPGDGGE
jgi:hypothetical protein